MSGLADTQLYILSSIIFVLIFTFFKIAPSF